MSNTSACLAHATWVTAALALCVAATGCSSHGSNAGGPATSGTTTTSTTATSTTGATGTSTTGTATGDASSGAGSTAPSTPATRGSSTPLVVPTTPVKAPSGGSVTQTVAARTPSAAPSVAITAPAKVGNDVQVKLSVKRIKVTSVQPGDTAGPAIAVTATISNKGHDALSTSGVQVQVVDAANTPQTPMTSGPVKQIAAEVAPGATQSGTWVFHLHSPKMPVKATVWVSADLPTATFVGKI